MTESEKQALIKLSWELHNQVEQAYLAQPAAKGDAKWLEKQRFLLADMAMHLFQTCMKPDALDQEKLRNNLFSILTISEQFIPDKGLKQVSDALYQPPV